ncbi:MAG TPA: FMN-binding protein [Bacteroidota bacterium]
MTTKTLRTGSHLLGCSCLIVFTVCSEVFGQVFLSQQEALRLAFPTASTLERETVFLTDPQVRAIESKSRSRVESRVVTYYVAKDSSAVLGYAFFDRQTVRTMPATYMAVVAPDTSIQRVEILAFEEPEDYLPPWRWLSQFDGKSLNDELWVKRDIPNLSGATISAYTITAGLRRILATFAEAIPKEK